MTRRAQTQQSDARPVTDGLNSLLAATFQAYRDTHLAHFNVVGASFPQLHTLFEAQYQELWRALDSVAERLRAIGQPVAAEAFAAGGDDLPADQEALLRHLADANRNVSRLCVTLAHKAEQAGDIGTTDLATLRCEAHDKHAWMLEASLA